MIDERLNLRLDICLDKPHSVICKQARYQYAVAKGKFHPNGGGKLFDPYNVYGVVNDETGQPGETVQSLHIQCVET